MAKIPTAAGCSAWTRPARIRRADQHRAPCRCNATGCLHVLQEVLKLDGRGQRGVRILEAEVQKAQLRHTWQGHVEGATARVVDQHVPLARPDLVEAIAQAIARRMQISSARDRKSQRPGSCSSMICVANTMTQEHAALVASRPHSACGMAKEPALLQHACVMVVLRCVLWRGVKWA